MAPVHKCKGIRSVSGSRQLLSCSVGAAFTHCIALTLQTTLHFSVVVRAGQWASTDRLNLHQAQLLPADHQVRTSGPGRAWDQGRWPCGWARGTCRARRERALPDLGGSLPAASMSEDTEAQLPSTSCPCAGHSGPCALLLGFNQNSCPAWLMSHHPHTPPQLFVI